MLKYKKIRKGDLVKIISGKDVGKTGSVLKVDRDKGRVLVEGINLHKKSMRKTQKNQVGGIKDIESPLNVSNVMLVCPKCKKSTKIGFSLKNEKKLRICKKCNAEI